MAPLYRFVRSLAALFLLSLLLVVSIPARSQALTLDQLTRRASVIVEGQVASVTAEWTPDHTKIYTTVRLQVNRFHKGGTGSSTFDLRLLGGSVGEMSMVVIDQPRFDPGERVFLFLNPNYGARDIPVVGQFEGKLRITTNAQGADVLMGSGVTYQKSDVVSTIRGVMRAVGQ